MCGIAGYSLGPRSSVERTLAAQALLASIAERGTDAVGYAHRAGHGPVVVRKQRGGASGLLDALAVPAEANQVLLHVRDYTKGHPELDANNHPIRHGAVVGIHNGVVQNDDALFAAHGWERDAPGMTVDSEAIFALAEATRSRAKALEDLTGTLAAAWLDERRHEALYLARGYDRPMWLGRSRSEIFFASTERALELVERYAGIRLDRQPVNEGTMLTVVEGSVKRQERFTPDPGVPEDELPDVRTPDEAALCLERLAAIAPAPAF